VGLLQQLLIAGRAGQAAAPVILGQVGLVPDLDPSGQRIAQGDVKPFQAVSAASPPATAGWVKFFAGGVGVRSEVAVQSLAPQSASLSLSHQRAYGAGAPTTVRTGLMPVLDGVSSQGPRPVTYL
jgi:hypothetical protein